MSPRRLFGIALHLLLMAALALPGIVAPAQATAQALATSANPTGMAHSPCDGMSMPTMHGKAAEKMPAGTRHCDLSACLGAGCLPTVQHLPAHVPQSDSLIAWDQPVPPSRLPDTLLRPPIA